MEQGYFMAALVSTMTMYMVVLFLTFLLFKAFKKSLLKRKLKKYNLNDFEIVFTTGKMPVCIINKNDKNDIVFL